MSDPFLLTPPPGWSLTVGTAGRIFIVLAAILFAVSVLGWLFSPRVRTLERVGAWSFTFASLGLLGAISCLTALFIGNRFEYEYVWGRADTLNTIPYRIAGVWAGQEGSFLLWSCTAAIFALLTMRFTQHYRRWYTAAYGAFLGAIASILIVESPFKLIQLEGRVFVPVEGNGLAPSLQNYWMTIHPPVIFLGFGSLTIMFGLAFAALMTRDYENWIPIVRPWAILSMTLLALGLCFGGFWAYETLGWGGFWMWDPVENVSFVPWCFGVAFIHGILVQATKKKWQISNLLLGGLPFLAFLYGTFLTRSGFLADTSVHSFAEMNSIALRMLVGLMFTGIVGFAGLWSFRALQSQRARQRDEAPGKGIRRESFYALGNALFVMMGIATLVGMSVPLFMALSGRQPRVVEEGLYHQVLAWLFVPIMLLMASAPLVSWRAMPRSLFLSRIYNVASLAIGLTGATVFLAAATSYGQLINLAPTVSFLGREAKGLMWLIFLVGLSYFAIVGNVWRMLELRKGTRLGLSPFLSHVGAAVLIAGLIISRGFEETGRTVVMEDHPGRVLNYEVRYQGLTSSLGDRDNRVIFEFYDIKNPDKLLFLAKPGLYEISNPGGEDRVMVWPSIKRMTLKDVYLSMAPPQQQSSEEFTLEEGESVMFGGLSFTHEGISRDESFGQSGPMFGVLVRVNAGGTEKTVNPKLEVASVGGTISHPAELENNMELVMNGMNAADGTVTLQVHVTRPIYPIEVFHKPMTILVWLGTGLLTFAGLLAAFYRRTRKGKVLEEPALEETRELSAIA
jgi:cytochrome c-type biogenesis protein CcmF